MRGWGALTAHRFKAQIEAVLGRATGYARRGRPPLQRDTGTEAN
jgi:hypothetical protein